MWLHILQRKKGISPKLSRPWQGPYVVMKCINDLIYKIQLGPRAKPKIFTPRSTVEVPGENPPTWFQAANTCPNPSKLLKLWTLRRTPKGMILEEGLQSSLSNHCVTVVATVNLLGGSAWPTIEECTSRTSGGGGVMKRHRFGYN